MEPDPRPVNQPNGSPDILPSSRARNPRAKRASTTCSHSVRAAPSNVPRPSSETAASPTCQSRDSWAPDNNIRANSTSSTNGASCTRVATTCSTPDRIRAKRSGASNRPAAWARQLPRGVAATGDWATGSGVSACASATSGWSSRQVEAPPAAASGTPSRQVPISRPAVQYAWACTTDLGNPNASRSRLRTCLRAVASGVAHAYQSDQSLVSIASANDVSSRRRTQCTRNRGCAVMGMRVSLSSCCSRYISIGTSSGTVPTIPFIPGIDAESPISK
ncbi:transmembrane ABC transporter ATP-binding protein [Mycobacterium marinum str. Europe]|nr:transmembrane ABC transporter ATP-binding protein [Mycobacterium marinum str. Europe]